MKLNFAFRWLSIALALVFTNVCSTVKGQAQMSGSNKMMWVSASNATALCNDYTRAGFFIRQNLSSNNWVVFLESGGLCYNTESCNGRFFVKKVREEFTDSNIPDYESFDPSKAWNETIQNGIDPTRVISPLMTSMKCFENVTEYFPNGLSSSIEGRDILDPDPAKNYLFYSYNHVVIPYCSSDIWLGEETTNTEAVRTGTSQCDCFNYTTSSNDNGCFTFDSKIKNLQFTFRGKIIYQSIIRQLLDDYGMDNADMVILAGSSAGGLGVINHAKWTRETLNSSADLMVIFDSAWFIDFQDGIEAIFKFNLFTSNNERLFNTVTSNSVCNDTDRLGYPCCISAHCVMTQQNSDGELQYYPKDTPTFALFSIYDIYLLAPGLARVANLESVRETANTGDGNGGVGVILDFMRIAGEYGGVMNSTLDVASSQTPFLSYYVTQCFQHIYLATSTLWGTDGQSVFGSDSLELNRDTTTFSHFISSNRWTKLSLATDSSKSPATILDALTSWLALNGSDQIKYTDACQGILCNSECPDKLQLGELTSNNWHTGIKIFIALLITGLAVVCIIMKISFRFWLYRLEKKQDEYISSLDDIVVTESTDYTPQFPSCDEENKISISCLDLHYSVKCKKAKYEKEEETEPMVLVEFREEDSEQRSVATKSANAVGNNTKHGRCEILKGISAYFNPGNLIGIMGPSGCGKTTFLDLLTGRRKYESKNFEEGIYVNGIPIEDTRKWYTANTGYVLQLATPYYEELTVRENLTLAAQMKLPSNKTLCEKFERVEQVMQVTGLLKAATARVGGSTGPGLSGGQKKRLAIALQLLNLPSVIFLDEPTSGLDATASLDLLKHLDKLADSNRTVILTIHQPRLEIFGMFHQLVLLSNGKVAYHDVPYKAYEVFVNALASSYLKKERIIPSLLEGHNPADVIMDMLGNSNIREVFTEAYQKSEEQSGVRNGIKYARKNTQLPSVKRSKSTSADKQSSSFSRMAVLEARADKRASLKVLLFLPVMFLIFGFALGTTYIQVSKAVLVVSGMCVFSTASALFMFPALYIYYKPALDMYTFEKADGVGFAHDIVVQGFIRFASIALIPVFVAVSVIYLLLINSQSYDFLIYLQVLLVNIALNQTWIALLIALICACPGIAFRLSPVISAVAGFSSGFFIPIGVMHWGYRWLAYINPNYYGLSSIAFFVLSEFETDCTGNQLECYISSGPYVLNQFFFDNINPYLHLVVLLTFTCFYLMIAVFANWIWHASITSILKSMSNIKHTLRNSIIDRRNRVREQTPLQEVLSNEGRIETGGLEEAGSKDEEAASLRVWLPGSTSSNTKECDSLKSRQQKLYDRIHTIQVALPNIFMEIDAEAKPEKIVSYEKASKQFSKNQSILDVSKIISQCQDENDSANAGRVEFDGGIKRTSGKSGMISLSKWKETVRKNKAVDCISTDGQTESLP